MSTPKRGVKDDIDDEALVLEANKNDYALQLLFLRYNKLLMAKANQFSSNGSDFEDFLQEGRIGLYKAILKFNGKLNVPFSAFAKLCVERQMLTYIRNNKRQNNVDMVNFDDEIFSDYSLKEDNNPEKFVIDKEDYKEIVNLIEVNLSKFEKKVINFYLTGKSYKDIAQELKKDTKAVDNALCRIKTKIAVSLKAHSNICP